MITVITRFAVPATINASQMRAAFTQAAPAFRNVPGLIRKQFFCQPMGTQPVVFTCGRRKKRPRSFMQQRVAPMIRKKFQVEPTIEFYHSPVLVEN